MAQARILIRHLGALLRWLALGAAVGALCGAGSAGFLWLLDLATTFRLAHEQIVFALPAAGLVIGTLYARYGASVRAGTNLVIDTIHDDGPEIPLRMFPFVLAGTVLTHLFGGSAGREGTAVQMGASITDFVFHRARLPRALRTALVAAGAAGGFGSVFGTPIAGTLFGVEFVRRGRFELGALAPALAASVTGDFVTRALGTVHASYPAAPHVAVTPQVAGAWLVLAAAVAVAAKLFVELTHWLKRVGIARVPWLGVRMAIAGALVVGAWQLVPGGSDYLGLGVPTIVRAFGDPNVPAWGFAAKLGFTAVTIGAGFLGGEVTPLFFIGAALGGTLGPVLGLPRALAAACGMSAMFGAAANTPIALAVMAVELVGGEALPHVAVVCVIAALLSGRATIYPSQLREH